MKASLVHGVWLVAAISSFVLGMKLFSPGGVGAGSRAYSEGRVVGRISGGAASVATGELKSGERLAKSVGEKRADSKAQAELRVALTEEDIIRLGEKFKDSASPVDRRLAFSQLLKGLTPENALKVREQIAHMDHHSAEFREFHYAWGAVGGVEAIMFGADTKEDDMSPALAGWASANPSEALAWFEGLDLENDARFDPVLKDRDIPVGALRHGLMKGMVQGLAAADPDTASQFVQDMAAAGQKGTGGMMHVVAEAVMRTDAPAEAALWSESLPPGHLRSEAMERVADRFVESDPEAARAWAEKFSDEPESGGVVAEVAAHVASQDPQEALDWLNGLPEGHGQNAGMQRTLREWAHRDPTAAGEYLQTMPVSPARDSAISGYSRRVVWEDPRAAMDWAESISSQDQRLETVIGVGRSWRRKDANGAAEWVNNSGLPEDVQRAILSPPRRD